jgi:competence protein ComEC
VAGLEWTWDGVRFSVLHPTRRWYFNPYVATNDRSCVIEVEAQGGSFLLAGDISRIAEEDLLARRQVSKADVLLVPHHGSATSSSERFVEAVSPRYAVFSVGYRNRFGHPRADVVERYARQGAELARTDSGGAWIFTTGAGGVTGKAWREVRRRYWQGL